MEGICFVNRSFLRETPAILDLGVTALELLGVDVPADYEGMRMV
jgi:hypothetical protein